MANMIKYYVKNRFIWVFYVWVIILGITFNGNPYINAILLLFGAISIMLAFSYIEEECNLNAQERLFLKKFS